jgi:serine/threonine protein kinase
MVPHANVCPTIGSYLKHEGDTEKLNVLMPYHAYGNVASFLEWLAQLRSEFAERALDSLLLLMTLDVAQGMLHMHSYDIIHRDLAARNLLISQAQSTIAVSDFGLSRPLEDTHHTGMGIIFVFCLCLCVCICSIVSLSPSLAATIGGIFPLNTPPEVINSNAFRKESDVYSFGMLVWALFSYGLPEFHPLKGCSNMVSIIQRITSGALVKELDFKGLGVPAFVEHLVLSCLNVDPLLRPNFRQIEADLWDEVGDTQESRELFRSLLQRYACDGA